MHLLMAHSMSEPPSHHALQTTQRPHATLGLIRSHTSVGGRPHARAIDQPPSPQVGVFDFGSRSTPLVLLLDRRDDPVTPLLTQWTYQVGACFWGALGWVGWTAVR